MATEYGFICSGLDQKKVDQKKVAATLAIIICQQIGYESPARRTPAEAGSNEQAVH